MYSIPLNTALTDSFTLKIPFLECDIIDNRLTSRTFVYYEDLQGFDDSEAQPPKPIIIQYNGITFRIGLIQHPIWDDINKIHVTTQFILITITSKLLHERYFEGITKDNIRELYDYLLSYEIFSCTYETFLNSRISDIDICINYPSLNPLIYQESLTVLANQTGTKRKHIHLITEPLNIGLTFNKRDYAKPSLPFCKFYHKQFELESKSAEFYNAYLFKNYAAQVKNLTRVECTLKNARHKDRLIKFGIIQDFKTLQEFLQLPQKQLFDFVIFSVYSYIENKPRKKAPNLSPSEHIMFQMMQSLVLANHSLESIKSICVDTFEGSSLETTKVAKSRMKKQVHELYKLLIDTDEKIERIAIQNQNVLDYLKFLDLPTFKYKK